MWNNRTYKSSIGLWLDPRVLRAKGIDDPPQTKIQSRGEESWGDGQTHNLHQEARLLPLIVPA